MEEESLKQKIKDIKANMSGIEKEIGVEDFYIGYDGVLISRDVKHLEYIETDKSQLAITNYEYIVKDLGFSIFGYYLGIGKSTKKDHILELGYRLKNANGFSKFEFDYVELPNVANKKMEAHLIDSENLEVILTDIANNEHKYRFEIV